MAEFSGFPAKSSALPAPRLVLMSLDQGLLSVLALCVNLALIHWSTREQYALFSLVMSCALLAQGLQSGAICTPLVVLGSRLSGGDYPAFHSLLQRTNIVITVILAIVCAAFTLVFLGGRYGTSLAVVIGAAILVLGLLMREFRRTDQLRGGRLVALVSGDAAVVLLTLSWLGLLVVAGRPLSALDALVALGGSNLIVSMRAVLPNRRVGPLAIDTRREWRSQATFAGSGAVVAWVQSASYPILVAAAVGTAAVADVAAARLFISPGALVGAAWGRLGLLRASEALRDGGISRWKQFVRQQVPRVTLGAVTYVGVVGTAAQLGAARVLGPEYENPLLIWCWLSVALITVLRSVASVALQALGAFRDLLRWTAVSAVVTCAAVLVLGPTWGAVACILGLGLGELVSLAAFFLLIARRTASAK